MKGDLLHPRTGFRILTVAALAFLALGLALLFQPAPAQAAPAVEKAAVPMAEAQAPHPALQTDVDCLTCHSNPDMQIALPNGDPLRIGIDPEKYAASVHGSRGFVCINCHADITGYPHPEQTAQDSRDYTLQFSESCKTCHEEQYTETQDGVHMQALQSGNRNAPACADCHDPHYSVATADDQGGSSPIARAEIPQTCAKCHAGIFNDYKNSVHGAGILENNDPNVPTCTDCHGVHSIADPTTAEYRINSPQMCAECHTNAEIMEPYGLSTQVLNTYVADFHGTTVTLFEKQSPDQLTNKPVCYDCHGVHDIRATDDPEKGLQLRGNIRATCEKCHPGSGDNFPDSWLSHYIPSPEKYPLVYYVQLFYQIFIPTVLGGMGVFVLSDIYRRQVINRRKPTPPAEPTPETPAAPQQDSDAKEETHD